MKGYILGQIQKKIGIWMDHADAFITEVKKGALETQSIQSGFTHGIKESTLSKSETTMHNKEQHMQSDYFKKLASIIENFDAVLLFGPTDAKSELLNLLSADNRFSNIIIQTEPADKMSIHQQHVFLKNHFAHNRYVH